MTRLRSNKRPSLCLSVHHWPSWIFAVTLLVSWLATYPLLAEDHAETILYNGKIVTVDDKFSIAQAIAIRGRKILQVGSNDAVMETKNDATRLVDLQGKMVLPGLMDSHTHPGGASMHEFDHPVPDMESIQDVLEYIHSRTQAVPEGEWIWVNQVFITRLREQRYPTRAELDKVAPKHPVVFSTGPDASVNSLALQLSGIDKNFRSTGSGAIEKDATTGEPTGILRGGTKRYLKSGSTSGRKATEQDQDDRLVELLEDYNSVGITAIADRSAGSSAIQRYQRLRDSGRLSVRVAISHSLGTDGKLESIQENIREIAKHPLCKGDAMLRIVGVKTFQDGGMLTGSAYMREPWGVSKIYSIDDPRYQGVLFIAKEDLLPIVRTVIENKLQFTAHSVGDGAVHNLVDVYEDINKTLPIRDTRPCITHCNFMSEDAVQRMAKLGVVADIQPAWLYLDARTLTNHFGYDRLRYFQPLHSIFAAGGIAGGGSDHMQKIGSLRSINPYNPFLGMWVTITRQAKNFDRQLHPEEALTREQAIRFYTTNNAYLMFLDSETGSLEAGKAADLIVLDRDLLKCDVDDIKDAQVLATYLGGKLIYEKNANKESNASNADAAEAKVSVVVGSLLPGEGEPNAAVEKSPLKMPFGIDFDSDGNMIIVELAGGRVHRLAANGELTQIAGDGSEGYTGDGGTAAKATFKGMHNVAVTPNGDIYIADTWNNCIRKIDKASGNISTIAGTGEAGFSGDGGPATKAKFDYVMCITLNAANDKLYVADLKNLRIRLVDLKNGIVTTIAGNGQQGVPLDGALAAESPLIDPRAVTVDSRGQVYVLERGGHALRVVSTDGKIRTVAGTGKSGFQDGAALESQLAAPKHLCVDNEENVYIADEGNHAIRKYDPRLQTITTVLGRGQGQPAVKLNRPHGVCIEKGKLYVVDSENNRILRID